MTLTLELADRKEAVLKARAQARGLSAEQYASQVLDRDLEEECPPNLSGKLSPLKQTVCPMRPLPIFRRTARASTIITSMGLPREILESGFCRWTVVTCNEVLTEFLAYCASDRLLLLNNPDIRIAFRRAETLSSMVWRCTMRPVEVRLRNPTSNLNDMRPAVPLRSGHE